ncbi:hypothetical protein [Paraburkholderia graminis]
MSNKNPPSNAWSAGNQPTPSNKRGKTTRIKFLAAIDRKFSWTEDDFWDHVAEEAIINKEKEMITAMLRAMVPTPRQKLPTVQFQYDKTKPYHEQIEQIIDLTSTGDLSPDEGSEIINQIKSAASVYEQSELVKRIEQLEADAVARKVKPAGEDE